MYLSMALGRVLLKLDEDKKSWLLAVMFPWSNEVPFPWGHVPAGAADGWILSLQGVLPVSAISVFGATK